MFSLVPHLSGIAVLCKVKLIIHNEIGLLLIDSLDHKSVNEKIIIQTLIVFYLFLPAFFIF